MRGQRGLSLSGFMLWAVLVVIVLLLGFKIAPAYFEYLSIQKQFEAIANDDSLKYAPRRQIEMAFYNRTTIEDIKSVTPKDMEIRKDGDRLVISAAYSVRVPLFGNVSACIDFAPTSEK